METKYYDGTKLLSMKDINGNTPEIYLCTTNRSGGKTTWFSRYMVKRFINGKGKFMLLYRFAYEVQDIAEKFFKDIGRLFFPSYSFASKSKARGLYQELYLSDDKTGETLGDVCGYAISLNNADAIKRFSHLFSDVTVMFFDEFQSETNKYAPNEVDKLISLHTSIARGNGEQVRYVPLIMCSNGVSIINPYYVALGIANRLSDNTKFLKGDGFVLEQGYVESASMAQKQSAFNRAFSNSKYVEYASENVYLKDNQAFIETPKGKARYILTIGYKGKNYAIREFQQHGIVYVDDRPDMSFPDRVAVTVDEHRINYVMLARNNLFVAQLRMLFEKGCFRFKNLSCKEAILTMLSY